MDDGRFVEAALRVFLPRHASVDLRVSTRTSRSSANSKTAMARTCPIRLREMAHELADRLDDTTGLPCSGDLLGDVHRHTVTRPWRVPPGSGAPPGSDPCRDPGMPPDPLRSNLSMADFKPMPPRRVMQKARRIVIAKQGCNWSSAVSQRRHPRWSANGDLRAPGPNRQTLLLHLLLGTFGLHVAVRGHHPARARSTDGTLPVSRQARAGRRLADYLVDLVADSPGEYFGLEGGLAAGLRADQTPAR